MRELAYTLLGDGSSDEVLLRPIGWLLERHLAQDIATRAQWADLRSSRTKPKGLAERIPEAARLYPCDVLFVHRDGEGEAPEMRRDEIQAAFRQASVPPLICVIPVRMQEAWLLFDEPAIRRAAGNPNGKKRLELPNLRVVESLPDPKLVLRDCLRIASELSGRRLDRFRRDESQAARRVADYIEDFSPLRRLSAFQRLEDDVAQALANNGWSSRG